MTEQHASQKSGAQDTGNPVLDSFVNIVSAGVVTVHDASLRELHKVLVELATKEPGGLQRAALFNRPRERN